MELSDIFKGTPPAFSSAPTLRNTSDSLLHAQDIDASITTKVGKAVETFDEMHRKAASYNFKKKALLREVEEQLRDLKEAADTSAAAHAAAKDLLREAMEQAGTLVVPMTDRPAIKFKTTTGQKKNITKKWLISTFGDKTALKIWSQVPTRPNSTELVILPSFDDQPSD